MTSNAALILGCLAVFFPFSAESPCRKWRTCPCGSTGKNVSICVGESSLADVCSGWSGCKSCRDGLERCWECPQELEGPHCDQVSAIQRKFFSRQKRQTRRRRPTELGANGSEPRNVYVSNIAIAAPPQTFCDNPGTISLGRISLDFASVPPRTSLEDQELPLGTRVRYSCNPGYSLEGSASLTCEETGYWSANKPLCKRVSRTSSFSCNNPGPIHNGRVLPDSSLVSEEYPAGTKLEYSCQGGYTLKGSSTISCHPSGVWSDIKPICEPDCGKTFRQPITRVFNGTETLHGDWPWVVGIKNGPRLICAGALLDSTTVLTAAHCLTRADYYTLVFGKLYLSDSDDDREVKARNSSLLILHPHFNTDFSKSNFDSDIALVTFSPKIEFTKRIQPVCLPTPQTTVDNLVYGRRGDVAGWGLNERGFQPKLMMLANIPVRTNKECMASYSRAINRTVELTQNQFCAGNENGQHSLCESDSGSPMVFLDERTESYTVEGLVSFRIGQCGRPGRFTVFTNVYNFVPWIRCKLTQRRCTVE